MEKQAQPLNKMGTQPVQKLLITMGLPMIISMAVQAIYNIVDSYFVSKIEGIGDEAMNAMTLAFPVQMLMVAIGVGTGVGINALLSKSLGEGDREKASRIAGNSIFIGLCMFVIFFIFGIFGTKAYVLSQTKDPFITDLTSSYLRICCCFSLGVSMYMTFEKLLQATGKTMQSTIAQLAGAVANIILDPIMIFGWLGLPKMGIAGAAYATVIGQFISFFMDAAFHFKYNKAEFSTSLRYIRPKLKIIREIFAVGIPAILMQALMSFMTYGVNIIFAQVSAEAVTAYGVYYKIQQFVFFAAFGMNNAMIPIIGFNYGMGSSKRVKDGIKYGMIYTIAIMMIGAVGLQIFAQPLINIFTLSDKTHELCIAAIRIITLGYIFVGANIAYQGIFQALGKGVHSLVLSAVRLLIAALPAAWILVQTAQDYIWAAFPFAELLAFIIALFMIKSVDRKVIKAIPERETE